jgi:serine/threonine-protein kinase HipA
MPDISNPPNDLTIQSWFAGEWHDAATVVFHEPEKGHRGATTTFYLLDYFAEKAAADSLQGAVTDERAVSVRMPVGLEDYRLPHWPAFLMDMLPQGPARILLGKALGLNAVLPSSEVHLLAYAAGAPVGNLRIAEASTNRVSRADMRGIALDDVLRRSDAFVDFATSLPWACPSAVCLQGEWPKLQLTMTDDGLLYPDAAVEDRDARQRYIVKLARSRNPRDSLILELEAIYARVAADLGLSILSGHIAGDGVLVMPRFDRDPDHGASRVGQESLVSARGIAEFGHLAAHEDYLRIVAGVSADPVADRLEYLKRDLLNLSFGNDDNHGRNVALSKKAGSIRLAPVFDFAPMRLSGSGIARSTKWACMKESGGDYRPDWFVIASNVAADDAERQGLLDALAEFAERLPAAAATVMSEVSDKNTTAHALTRLEGMVSDAVSAAVGQVEARVH